ARYRVDGRMRPERLVENDGAGAARADLKDGLVIETAGKRCTNQIQSQTPHRVLLQSVVHRALRPEAVHYRPGRARRLAAAPGVAMFIRSRRSDSARRAAGSVPSAARPRRA